ncbi:hypothetical protein OIU78_023131 [Salix suchowensis]|nr:hypothetical protein OIU78_023131 [Salix suchowensis]
MPHVMKNTIGLLLVSSLKTTTKKALASGFSPTLLVHSPIYSNSSLTMASSNTASDILLSTILPHQRILFCIT